MKKWVAALGAGLLAASGVLAATQAQAQAQSQSQSSSAHRRVVALAASSTWAILKAKTTAADLNPTFGTGGSLSAVNRQGLRRELPGFSNEQNATYTRSLLRLTGSELVQAETEGADVTTRRERVRYLDLSTGEGGTGLGRIGDVVLAAAPGGWLIGREVTPTEYGDQLAKVVLIKPDGSETSFGQPFAAGEGFALVTGERGVVAYTQTVTEAKFDVTARYATWAEPGTWRTVLSAPEAYTFSCTPPSATHVGCSVSRPGKGIGLAALDGSGVRWLRDAHPAACRDIVFATVGANIVASEGGDAGVCSAGKLFRFPSVGGKLAASTKHYNVRARVIQGLGGLLVDSGEQRVVYRLSGVTRSPVVAARG